MCPCNLLAAKWACGAAASVGRVVVVSYRIGSRASSAVSLGSKDVGRSFWLVRLANGQTCGPASSISPAQSRPRALRRSTASDSTDTPVSQSRALARCRPVIKLPRGRGDVALWSGDARSSIPGARSRSTLYYWTTVRCSSSQERGEFVTDTVMPHAVCRLPFTYLPDSSVGFSHGSHGKRIARLRKIHSSYICSLICATLCRVLHKKVVWPNGLLIGDLQGRRLNTLCSKYCVSVVLCCVVTVRHYSVIRSKWVLSPIARRTRAPWLRAKRNDRRAWASESESAIGIRYDLDS